MMGAQIIVGAGAAYLGLGALFALAFVTVGAGRIDRAARGAPWGFRALIFPGAAALWPVLLVKWVRARSTPGAHP